MINLIHTFDGLTALHVLNICIIMLFIFYLVWFVSDKKHSLFWGFYWFIITMGRHREGLIWYASNPIYIVYRFIIIILLGIDITLIGQLIDSDIFNKPIWLLFLSPCIFTLFLIATYINNKRALK